MADKFKPLRTVPPLPPRPREEVRAQQQRHDRGQRRALIAVFGALIVGGGLGAFIVLGPLFRGMETMQAVLVMLVFVLPFLASLVFLSRVPPPPSEAFTDPDHEIDHKERERRAVLLSQALSVGIMALQSFWLWPLLARHHNNLAFVLGGVIPTFVIVGMGLAALYVRPHWFNSNPRPVDDEVMQSFRARAQSLGYLLLLTILAGLMILAPINPALAVRSLPVGVAVGVILPVLYFVYLDWRASG